MLKNQDIICISSIDWDFIWQGHQEIMSRLAKNGNRIIFIENTGVRVPGIRDFGRIKLRIKNWFSGVKGIRKESDNLYIFSPLVFPFPYLRIAKWLNRRMILSILGKWMKIMDFNNPLIWVFLPTPLSLDIIDSLNNKAVVYYCIDNFRVSSKSAKKIERSEIKLLKKSDLVFVTSRELYNYCSHFNDNVHIFPFAVNFEGFEKSRLAQTKIPEEIKILQHPLIGYVGGLHKWLDFDLVKRLAEARPEYSFVFVGPVQSDISAIEHLKNIHFLGQKEHKSVPILVKYFSLCIIPYLITDYTKNVYPTKLNEYLAMGKPVVSTDLPEIQEFNSKNNQIIAIGTNFREFLEKIDQELKLDNIERSNIRVSAAKKNSWEARINEMGNLIRGVLDKKAKETTDWQEGLLKIYRTWRKRMAVSIILIFSAYILLLYTPLIWLLAKPLMINNQPRKSDCIVVFAGGVGESGKPGQGYEERVERAVELYKQGYADHIIFSSGYAYFFKEPLIMKALAESLGVPKEAIILEDKAKDTYQNVMFSKEILDQKKWKSILLVSSPYHMRRAYLVFKKNAKEESVSFVPVLNSLFYSHPASTGVKWQIQKQANFKQINGIIHEYLGILYYWWKGLI